MSKGAECQRRRRGQYHERPAWLFPGADIYSGGAILGARLFEVGARLTL